MVSNYHARLPIEQVKIEETERFASRQQYSNIRLVSGHDFREAEGLEVGCLQIIFLNQNSRGSRLGHLVATQGLSNYHEICFSNVQDFKRGVACLDFTCPSRPSRMRRHSNSEILHQISL